MNDKNAKDIIIETTIRMIQEKGYNNISTNHISKQAGLSIGTLYYHFKNGKPDIIKEMIKSGYGEFLDDTKFKDLKYENLPDFLKLFFSRFIIQHRSNIALMTGIEIALLTDKNIFKDVEYAQNELKLFPLIANILIQIGYPDKENINEISKFLLNCIDSIVHRHIMYENVAKNDEKLIEFLIELVLRFVKS